MKKLTTEPKGAGSGDAAERIRGTRSSIGTKLATIVAALAIPLMSDPRKLEKGLASSEAPVFNMLPDTERPVDSAAGGGEPPKKFVFERATAANCPYYIGSDSDTDDDNNGNG